MASETEHVECANRTQRTIVHLLKDPDTNSPWLATTAFYKALHVVEAVFYNDSSIQHTNDHGCREDELKKSRRYEQIYKHYSPLKRASLNARYLSKCATFDEYLSPQDVMNTLLRHHLHQIEVSAIKTIKSPNVLQSIMTAFPS